MLAWWSVDVVEYLTDFGAECVAVFGAGGVSDYLSYYGVVLYFGASLTGFSWTSSSLEVRSIILFGLCYMMN